jgi:hypothetical protein
VVVSVGFQRNDIVTGPVLSNRITYLSPVVDPEPPGPWTGNTTGLVVTGYTTVGNDTVPTYAPQNITITGQNFGLAGSIMFGSCCNITSNSSYVLSPLRSLGYGGRGVAC